MKEQLISFETAKLAKEKGFDWKSLFSYNEDGGIESAFDFMGEMYFSSNDMKSAKENGYFSYLAPTQSLLQKWLRDEFFILIEVHHHPAFGAYSFRVKNVHSDKISEHKYDTYEIVLEKGLFEALKLIK